MGQLESQPSYYKQVQNEDGSFVIVTNDPIDSFEFCPSQSRLVSYGIDYQTNPKFKSKTLGPITGTDAQLVCDSFIDVGAFPAQNTAVYVASKQAEECNFTGIKKTFQDCATKVGRDGLLVFHFSGHGIKVGQNEWGLAPVDFDYSRSTYLTASVLISWINEIKCKAKYILFTLDCCYAGGIGKELTKSVEVQVNASICVMSACAGYETSIVIGPLRNSIFAYFLSDAILCCQLEVGLLPIKEVFSRCQVCCESLSSLLVRYKAGVLSPSTMQPQLGALHLQTAVKELSGEGVDQVDAAIGRFSFAVCMYDQKWNIPPLSEKSYAYLETVSMEEGPLLQLEENGVLFTRRVLNTVICSMMYSVAATELVSNPENAQNPNLSITAFMHCVAAIDMIHSGVEFNKFTFYVSWLFYREVLIENNINIASLQPMFEELQSTCYRQSEEVDNNLDPAVEPTESTDFAAVSLVFVCILWEFVS